MRLPRDVSGRALASALRQLGYRITRQKGGHIRLAREQEPAHRVTVPDHKKIKVGTLHGILKDISENLDIGVSDLADRLFGR